MDMELSKKTTILLSPALHDRLTKLAQERKTSLGELVRAACEREYTQPTREEKLAAVRRIAALKLPVSDVRTMKRQSVPHPDDLLP